MAGSFFEVFGAHAATVAAAAARMRDLGLTPQDVLDQYEARMAEMMAGMTPATQPEPAAPDTRRAAGQADTEYRLGPCPRCGGEIWGIKKCPHISPPWRTFLACDNDACDYHGRSRMSIQELRLSWPAGVEED